MKRHLAIDGIIICTPNVGRGTSRFYRMNKRPSVVTCEKCRKMIARFKPEYVERLEAAATKEG